MLRGTHASGVHILSSGQKARLGCAYLRRTSRYLQCLQVAITKLVPTVFARRNKSVPMNFETVSQLAHGCVQRRSFAHRAEVIAIRFMLRETNHLTIGKLAQECDVGLANRCPQIAA